LANGEAATLPNVTTDETRALKAWYLAELRKLRDEVRELRHLQDQDRTLLLELVEAVRFVTGANVDPGVTLQ
jgi:hypothetical protein